MLVFGEATVPEMIDDKHLGVEVISHLVLVAFQCLEHRIEEKAEVEQGQLGLFGMLEGASHEEEAAEGVTVFNSHSLDAKAVQQFFKVLKHKNKQYLNHRSQ